MPKRSQSAAEMYRSTGGGRFRIVSHPVTMIQAERITKLEADVDGNRASGSLEFHIPFQKAAINDQENQKDESALVIKGNPILKTRPAKVTPQANSAM